MSKKEICLNNEVIAYYFRRGFGKLEIHYIEHDIEDYVYFTVNEWYGKKTYHKAKIHYFNYEPLYFNFRRERIFLDDCITV